MARIPTASRESVPPEQVAAFDEYVAGRGGIPETGPMSVLLHVPELIRRGEHLRAYLRGDESSLPANIRELGMLVAAREMDCQFIWHAHAALARQAGLSDALVDNLRDHKELPELSPPESAVIAYGREFFRTHRRNRGYVQRRPNPIRRPRSGRANQPDGLLRLPRLQHQRLRSSHPPRNPRTAPPSLTPAAPGRAARPIPLGRIVSAPSYPEG